MLNLKYYTPPPPATKGKKKGKERKVFALMG